MKFQIKIWQTENETRIKMKNQSAKFKQFKCPKSNLNGIDIDINVAIIIFLLSARRRFCNYYRKIVRVIV